MARTTATRRVTRLDREAASAGAQSLDLAPLARVSLVIVGVLVLAVGASIAVPDPQSIGGPLRDANVATAASMQTIRKVGDGAVTVGIFVPWNASDGTVVLHTLVPVGVEVVKTGVLPAGATAIEPTRGFPRPGSARVESRDEASRPATGSSTASSSWSVSGDAATSSRSSSGTTGAAPCITR